MSELILISSQPAETVSPFFHHLMTQLHLKRQHHFNSELSVFIVLMAL